MKRKTFIKTMASIPIFGIFTKPKEEETQIFPKGELRYKDITIHILGRNNGYKLYENGIMSLDEKEFITKKLTEITKKTGLEMGLSFRPTAKEIEERKKRRLEAEEINRKVVAGIIDKL
jgi:hypothetical protein